VSRKGSDTSEHGSERRLAAGYRIEDPAWRGAHLVGVRPPAGADLGDIATRLAAARVHVSMRGTSIRVSPHLYNTAEDMQAIATIDRHCRLIKGQVFLWKDDQTWEALWDVDGAITPA